MKGGKEKVEALYTRLGAPLRKGPVGRIEAGTLYTRLGGPTDRKKERRGRGRGVRAVDVKNHEDRRRRM